MASTDSADDLTQSQRREGGGGGGGGGGKAMLARHRAKEDTEAHGNPTKSQTQHQQQAAKSGRYLPLGYKDGFSQWWAGLTPAQTEHRVLSFVPYLQTPPTHTQTGSAPASTHDLTTTTATTTGDVDASAEREARPVRTTSIEDPYGPRQWHSKLVQLPGKGKNRYLNEFSVERVGEEEPQNNLVMLHGYGAGLGFFYKNFDALSRLPHWKLYALDLLGMGRSSRPPFRIHAKDKEGKVREAENWFVDALEEWRIARGIEKMTLLGHSLGGYMAVCYALKYPGHLNKLILASPVGIPEDPYAVSEELPDPESSTMQQEFEQSQDEIAAASSNNNTATTTSKPSSSSTTATKQPPKRQLPKWLITLWDANISPFAVVRLAGPLGPRLVSGWTTRRFSHLPAEEAQALHDYSYSLFRQRGSGEYALAYILAPGAFARSPLIRRIGGVGRQYLRGSAMGVMEGDRAASTNGQTATSTTTTTTMTTTKEHLERETGIPVVFFYGDKDWMDKAGGYASIEKIEAEKKKALEESAGAGAAEAGRRERENGDARVRVVRNAGHHVYLDGWEEFNRGMVEEMRDVERREKKMLERG